MIHARKDYDHIQDETGKIAEDEPVFLLRAKDSLAPNTLRFWANRLEDLNGDEATIHAIREHAQEMDEWQIANEYKLPDTPEDQLK